LILPTGGFIKWFDQLYYVEYNKEISAELN